MARLGVRLWWSLRATYNPFLAVGGFLLALAAFFAFPGEAVTIGSRWIVLALVVGCLAIAVLWNTVATTGGSLPRVVASIPESAAPSGISGTMLLMLAPSKLLGANAIVSIYRNELLSELHRFERLIGVGYVVNVQEDGRILVKILAAERDQTDIWSRIGSGDQNELALVLVKPSLPFDALELLRSFGHG